MYKSNIKLQYDFLDFNVPNKIFPKLTPAYDTGSYVAIDFFRLLFWITDKFLL